MVLRESVSVSTKVHFGPFRSVPVHRESVSVLRESVSVSTKVRFGIHESLFRSVPVRFGTQSPFRYPESPLRYSESLLRYPRMSVSVRSGPFGTQRVRFGTQRVRFGIQRVCFGPFWSVSVRSSLSRSVSVNRDTVKIQQYVLNNKDMYFSFICGSVGFATLHFCDKSETHFTRRGAYGEMTKLLPMKLSTNGI